MRWFCLCLALFFSLLFSTVQAAESGFIRGEALISASELHQLLRKSPSEIIVFAVAHTLDYRMGHIPGAYQLWRSDYELPQSKDVPFGGLALKAESFQKLMRQYGVNQETTVVVYDHKYDATRLWWIFKLYGKKNVRVLNGGYGAWKRLNYQTAILAPGLPSKQGDFVAQKGSEKWVARMTDVLRAKTDKSYQLWDTRSNQEWTGEQLKKGAFRKGRIPWAKFLSWKDFRDPQSGEFLSSEQMSVMVKTKGLDRNKKQIFYCQSGVRTTQEIFGLYLLGWPEEQLMNYDGSWIEWSYHSRNPVFVQNQ